MAAVIEKKVNKTAFVKKILEKNPEATHSVVIAAWEKAGHPGTISESLVKMTRSELGLTGNRRTRTDSTKKSVEIGIAASSNNKGSVGAVIKAEDADQASPTPVATMRSKSLGKSTFVKELLFDNPTANAKAVNEAWQAAGMDGTISESLVQLMRSKLGLTGNRREATKSAVEPVKTVKATVAAQTKSKVTHRAKTETPHPGERDGVLADVERDIDVIIFKLIGWGLPDIENALRTVRRQVIRSFEG